jgi:hypothetical protein
LLHVETNFRDQVGGGDIFDSRYGGRLRQGQRAPADSKTFCGGATDILTYPSPWQNGGALYRPRRQSGAKLGYG